MRHKYIEYIRIIYINNKDDESAREGVGHTLRQQYVLYNIDNTHIIYTVTRRRNKPIKCRYDVIIPS